jgi:uncharacterized protein (TIGR02646 family)
MIKVERSYPEPESLTKARKAGHGKYNDRDVIERLMRDFHGKCYICEIKVQDVQVEHLLPQKNGQYLDRKYDWDNLFLSCPHCNQVKNKKKYDEGIIDCCKQDPEEVLLFKLDKDDVKVQCFNQDAKVKRTADLVEEVFTTRSSGGLTIQSEIRMRALQSEMSIFYTWLAKYNEHPHNTLIRRTLLGLLKRSTEFAGFKRTYINEHKDKYEELYEMIHSE